MKLSIINLLVTVFLLWLTIKIEDDHELWIGYLFILSVGIIHGANDLSLISHINSKQIRFKFLYLVYYLILVLITVITFINLPIIALIIFIAMSCYHFGEQHFVKQLLKKQKINTLLFFSYGMVIFGLLFKFNFLETSIIIEELTGILIYEIIINYFLGIGLILLLFSYFLSMHNFNEHFNVFEQVFLLLLFSALFKLATLLWAFAIYFVVWHSIPSLIDQTEALYGNFKLKTFLIYLKKSLLTWVISILGLLLIYMYSFYTHINFITLFFAFLAAITVPHVIVMFILNKTSTKK